uniref:Uncharacterized protein n=1 Tax=Tetranychus urticae TaxID=32264 RepID=T1K3M4_TETUR
MNFALNFSFAKYIQCPSSEDGIDRFIMCFAMDSMIVQMVKMKIESLVCFTKRQRLILMY